MLFVLTRLLPTERALPEDSSDTRVSFAPSSVILSESESAPVAGNPLHKAVQSSSFELVELGDHIPEPEPTEQLRSPKGVPAPPRRL